MTKTKRQENARIRETRRLKNKLVRVISNAGLAYSSWISIIDLVDNIPGFDTAAWVYNDKTKEEHIWFSRRIVKTLTVSLLKLVLRHEMLHKSMYRGTEQVGNKELLNYALDCCINKILWLSDPKGMAKLGNQLFPEGTSSRTNVLSIMNPAITTEEHACMQPRIQKVYDRVWWVPKKILGNGESIDIGKTCHDYWLQNNLFGNDYVPDALTLYNAMASMLSKKDKQEISKCYKFMSGESSGKQGGESKDCKNKNEVPAHIRGGRFNYRSKSKDTIKAEKDIADAILKDIKKQGEKQDKGSRGRFRRGPGFSTFKNMKDYFDKYLYKPQSASTRNINEFIRHMETWKQVEGVTSNIYRNFRSRTAILPYPKNLTRIGFELVALGFNDTIPLYFNRIFSDSGGKKKVCCYFDTSPSMDSFIPYVVWMADFFDGSEECEIAGGKFNGRYGFSGKVKGIPASAWEDFKNGKVQGGASTSFEAVIEHACDRIDNDSVDVILVFTDGESSLSSEIIDRFNGSGKKCYTVYFAHEFGYKHNRHGQDPNALMSSDLDKLDGDSYTVWCPDKSKNNA